MDHAGNKELIAWLLENQFGARFPEDSRKALTADLQSKPDNIRVFIRNYRETWVNAAAIDLGAMVCIQDHDAFATELIEVLKKHFAEPAKAT